MGKKNRNCDFDVDSDLTAKLGGLAEKSYTILKRALYPGAGALADAIKDNLRAHSQKGSKSIRNSTRKDGREYEYSYERTGDLADSVTIVRMDQEGGKVTTAVIFAGYDKNGVPNAIKAAALESGTSKQTKTPFIRPAVNAVKARSNALMQQELDKIITEEMEK